jgi:hypothetical protein
MNPRTQLLHTLTARASNLFYRTDSVALGRVDRNAPAPAPRRDQAVLSRRQKNPHCGQVRPAPSRCRGLMLLLARDPPPTTPSGAKVFWFFFSKKNFFLE